MGEQGKGEDGEGAGSKPRGSGGGWGLWRWGGAGATPPGAATAPADDDGCSPDAAAGKGENETEGAGEKMRVQQEAGRHARAARGSGGGWSLWGGGAREAAGAAAGCSADAPPHEGADGEVGATARWRWLREFATKAVGAGAGLVQAIGERQYQILCVDKFHRDRVKYNKARAALALQRGEIIRPHRSPGVSTHRCQDQHREELAEDAVCARAVDIVYAENCEMITAMESEFAERVFLPDAKTASDDGTASDWSVDPKWVVVRLKKGVLRGGAGSEGVLVVFRGTHSWEDTMHDLLCIPTEHASGVMLHRGVNLAVSRAAPAILEALGQALHGQKSPRVILTGHSYGGALALALQLHSLVDEDWGHVASVSGGVSSVTFGAPLVFGCGGSKGCDHYLQRIHASSRQYVHQGDVVPRLLGRQGQVLLKALSKWRASQTAPNGEGGGAVGWWEVGAAFVSGSCEGADAVGSEQAGEGCGRAQRPGGVNAAINLAAGVVGTYQPVGSFRFVYTVPGDSSSPGCGHYIRLSESEDETLRLLQLEANLVWFTYLLVRDHSTEDYRSKVTPNSTVVHVVASGVEEAEGAENVTDIQE